MKVSTENNNNFGYEKITIFVDNMPLNSEFIDIKIIKIGHELTSRYIFQKLLFFMKYVGNIGSV